MGRPKCEHEIPVPGTIAAQPKPTAKSKKPVPKPGLPKPTVFAGQQSKPGIGTESSPEELVALRKRVTAILRSRECGKINFSISRFIVSGRGYRMVADAIDAGTIAITIAEASGYEAAYIPSQRRFQFPHLNYGVKQDERVSIVHEATHAVIDIYWKMNAANGNELTSADEEPIAYVAGTVFHELNVGTGFSAMGPPESHPAGAIQRQAQMIGSRIALEILNSKNRLLVAVPQVSPSDLALLSQFVATHPEYQ